jgi:hypothetical protein
MRRSPRVEEEVAEWWRRPEVEERREERERRGS